MNALKRLLRRPEESPKRHTEKGCPKAAARRQRLECVRGEIDKAILISSGTWVSEKNVPFRNVDRVYRLNFFLRPLLPLRTTANATTAITIAATTDATNASSVIPKT